MMTLHTPRLHRRGYTLAELLIVMTIMLMLAVITLPAVKNIMQDGAVREASRQLNSYFAMAKARALNTGRPCGVMMICDLPLGLSEPPAQAAGNLPLWPTKQITKLYLAEVPPPYSGGTVGARGRIMNSMQSNVPVGTYVFQPLLPGTAIPDGSPGSPNAGSGEFAIISSLIALNEVFLVRFDGKGAWFVCQFTPPSSNSQPEFLFLKKTSTGATTPLPPGFIPSPNPPPLLIPAPGLFGYTYQIMRLPRRIGSPLELTAGTCIDVAYCGIGPTNMPTGSLAYGMYQKDNNGNVPPAIYPLQAISIMFQPDGGIDSVFLNNWFFTPPTTVHLLVGRADKINPPFGASTTSATGLNMFDPVSSNLADPLSLWVSIARSTGAVNTSDNLPPAASAVSGTSATLNLGLTQQIINPTTAAGQLTYLQYCRQQATNREQAKTQ